MKTEYSLLRSFKTGYGEFPYVILKEGHALYVQSPIHFLGEGEEVDFKKYPGTTIKDIPSEHLKQSRESLIFLQHHKILEVAEFIIRKTAYYNKKTPEGCLVLGTNRAMFYRIGKFTPQVYIPTGGALLDQMGNIIGMNVEHYTPYEVTKEISDHEI